MAYIVQRTTDRKNMGLILQELPAKGTSIVLGPRKRMYVEKVIHISDKEKVVASSTYIMTLMEIPE